ncbi:hypothetical protein AB0K08_02040 [Citricoccus sp. NPDC055426]
MAGKITPQVGQAVVRRGFGRCLRSGTVSSCDFEALRRRFGRYVHSSC